MDLKQSTLEMLKVCLFYEHSCNKFILGSNSVPLLAVCTQISIEIFPVRVKRLKEMWLVFLATISSLDKKQKN